MSTLAQVVNIGAVIVNTLFAIAFLARWWLTRKSIPFRVFTRLLRDADGTDWHVAQLEGQDGFSTSRHRDAAIAHELNRAAWLVKQAGSMSRN